MSLIVSTEEARSMDSNRHASGFFAIPIELRRAVYGYLFDLAGGRHIQYLVGGDGVHQFRLTPCTAPTGSGDEERDGRERDPEPRVLFAKGPVYRRRLLSSWGRHWMCKELASFHSLEEVGDAESVSSSCDFSSALRVCKRM